MEKLTIDLIILLFVVAGLITFIKDAITIAKNPSPKAHHSGYHPQNGVGCYNGDTGNYYSSGSYDSSVSCDSGSFDIGGGDCGGGN